MTCRYQGVIESPPGYWSARCACGWGARSIGTKMDAVLAFERHYYDKDWWK